MDFTCHCAFEREPFGSVQPVQLHMASLKISDIIFGVSMAGSWSIFKKAGFLEKVGSYRQS
jgi:hypothetical protein